MDEPGQPFEGSARLTAGGIRFGAGVGEGISHTATLVDPRRKPQWVLPNSPPAQGPRPGHRQLGAAPPRTVDPSSPLVREINRVPTPNSAAHLAIGGRVWTAQGTKGDVPLNHHPLIRTYLDELPPGELVRGGESHAELIVVSDVLHEYDHVRAAEGVAPMGRGDAALLFEDARLEVFRIREQGDPAVGVADRPCDSCINFLVRDNVLPESARAYTETWQAPAEPDPDPGRFPPDVANALVAAGWRPHIGDQIMAAAAVRDVTAVPGRAHRHEVFPAALRR
ncbi:YwqJ-related putative deaminase [Micromonospora sp. NPDC005161]